MHGSLTSTMNMLKFKPFKFFFFFFRISLVIVAIVVANRLAKADSRFREQ